MHDRSRYDAVIVGARCAGAATAMLLARRGLRVLVIDRGTYGRDALSTHALMRAGVLQLARWGLLDELRNAGTPPVRATTFHYGDAVEPVAIKPRDGVDALYAPRRTVLDPLLVDAARRAGAEVRYGVRLCGLARDRSGRVCGVIAVDDAGVRSSIAARIVVGADGVDSTVARMVDAPPRHAGRHASAIVYGHVPYAAADAYHWYWRPGVSAGVIPTNDAHACIFVAVSPARYRAQIRNDVRAGYQRMLAEAAPDVAERVAEVAHPIAMRSFAGRRGHVRRSVGPGWALVGDAGYFKDPLTAHGMTDALRDADLLATAIADGSDTALAEYVALRDALSMPLFWTSDAVASFEWDLDAIRTHHAALAAAMRTEVATIAAWPR